MSCYNKISLLESCNQQYICSVCCDPTNIGYCQPFSTSISTQFLDHLKTYHTSANDTECVYCCCLVPNTSIIRHIQNHFLEENNIKTNCSMCSEPIKQHKRGILAHMLLKHGSENLVCPHCCNKVGSRDELQKHLMNSQLILFHCPYPKCFVKTQSKDAILVHLKSRHNGSRCIRVLSQYLCSEQMTANTNCTCLSTSNSAPLLYSPIKPDEPQEIGLPYSLRVLAKLSTGLDERLQEDLRSKMEQYSTFKVRLDSVDGQKQFVCSTCQYRSVHSLADVRKHILGCHCSVSTSYTRLCLRASRLDTNNLTLFSDKKLITFANEKLKKTDAGSTWETGTDLGSLQLLDDSEQECVSNPDSYHRSNKRHSAALTDGTGTKKPKLQLKQVHVAKMRPDSPIPEVGPPLERQENFDRVIHLNYSWPVLERLVQGQCPERYLPILKQKMDVYSQHRILLTRRNGKRYFLCSHCPNCSPHGMNDIRKHILGVHARLPERFKSAAMYCSRMNRDNYGLLSDEELLKKNQDMVRWRSNPAQNQDDFPLMESLNCLSRSLSPDDVNISSSTIKSHNVFLSGDNGTSSPPANPSTATIEPVTSYYQHFSQMPLTALFTSILTTNNNGNHNDSTTNNESSPPSNGTANVIGKGRSRRSLVLKSKTTNHNCQSAVDNII